MSHASRGPALTTWPPSGRAVTPDLLDLATPNFVGGPRFGTVVRKGVAWASASRCAARSRVRHRPSCESVNFAAVLGVRVPALAQLVGEGLVGRGVKCSGSWQAFLRKGAISNRAHSITMTGDLRWKPKGCTIDVPFPVRPIQRACAKPVVRLPCHGLASPPPYVRLREPARQVYESAVSFLSTISRGVQLPRTSAISVSSGSIAFAISAAATGGRMARSTSDSGRVANTTVGKSDGLSRSVVSG